MKNDKNEEFNFESELDDFILSLIPQYPDIETSLYDVIDLFSENDASHVRGLCFPDIERSIGRLEAKGKIRRIWEVAE